MQAHRCGKRQLQKDDPLGRAGVPEEGRLNAFLAVRRDCCYLGLLGQWGHWDALFHGQRGVAQRHWCRRQWASAEIARHGRICILLRFLLFLFYCREHRAVHYQTPFEHYGFSASNSTWFIDTDSPGRNSPPSASSILARSLPNRRCLELSLIAPTPTMQCSGGLFRHSVASASCCDPLLKELYAS